MQSNEQFRSFHSFVEYAQYFVGRTTTNAIGSVASGGYGNKRKKRYFEHHRVGYNKSYVSNNNIHMHLLPFYGYYLYHFAHPVFVHVVPTHMSQSPFFAAYLRNSCNAYLLTSATWNEATWRVQMEQFVQYVKDITPTNSRIRFLMFLGMLRVLLTHINGLSFVYDIQCRVLWNRERSFVGPTRGQTIVDPMFMTTQQNAIDRRRCFFWHLADRFAKLCLQCVSADEGEWTYGHLLRQSVFLRDKAEDDELFTSRDVQLQWVDQLLAEKHDIEQKNENDDVKDTVTAVVTDAKVPVPVLVHSVVARDTAHSKSPLSWRRNDDSPQRVDEKARDDTGTNPLSAQRWQRYRPRSHPRHRPLFFKWKAHKKKKNATNHDHQDAIQAKKM